MKALGALTLTLACSSVLAADDIARRVADDAKVVQRIAEVSKRDFPTELVGRILDEDLELLRGRRSNGTYDYARFEREEAARESDRFTVRSRDENRTDEHELSAERVYRVVVSVPSRRLLVAKNRRAFIDRVVIEYTPFDGPRAEREFEVGSWVEIGASKSFDLPEIARRAKATVHARVDDGDGGPATIEIAFLKPRLVDNPDSPYAGAVRTLKTLQIATDRRELAKIKAASTRLAEDVGFVVAADPATNIAVVPQQSRTTSHELESMPQIEIYMELQRIEDMLTGSEAERRDALDALHQLVRRLRPR